MIWTGLIVLVAVCYLFTFALCQAAKRGDEWMKEILRK